MLYSPTKLELDFFLPKGRCFMLFSCPFLVVSGCRNGIYVPGNALLCEYEIEAFFVIYYGQF